MEETNLTKVAKVINNEKYLILLGTAVLAIFIIFLVNFFKSPPEIAPKEYTGVKWKNTITPGQTKIDQLQGLLGSPLKREETTDSAIYYYRSDSINRPHKIEIWNKTVQIVK